MVDRLELEKSIDIVNRLGAIKTVKTMAKEVDAGKSFQELVNTFIQLELSDLLQDYIRAKREKLRREMSMEQQQYQQPQQQQMFTPPPELLEKIVKEASWEDIAKMGIVMSTLSYRDPIIPLLLLLAMGNGSRNREGGYGGHVSIIKEIIELLKNWESRNSTSDIEKFRQLLDIAKEILQQNTPTVVQQSSPTGDISTIVEAIKKLKELNDILGMSSNVNKEVEQLRLELERLRLDHDWKKFITKMKMYEKKLKIMEKQFREKTLYKLLATIGASFIRPISEKIADKIMIGIPQVRTLRVKCPKCGREVLVRENERWICPFCGTDIRRALQQQKQQQKQ